MTYCSRCFYLLAFFLFFATTGSFGQASCQKTADNSSALTFLQFAGMASESPACVARPSCSKQSAGVAVKAVKGEGAANALNCNPQNPKTPKPRNIVVKCELFWIS